MVDRLTKSLRKLSVVERKSADRAIERLIVGDMQGLHPKKLRGASNTYRARKGRLRIIYELEGKKVTILDVGLRSDTTYKKY